MEGRVLDHSAEVVEVLFDQVGRVDASWLVVSATGN
jgi:hypothetical protein